MKVKVFSSSMCLCKMTFPSNIHWRALSPSLLLNCSLPPARSSGMVFFYWPKKKPQGWWSGSCAPSRRSSLFRLLPLRLVWERFSFGKQGLDLQRRILRASSSLSQPSLVSRASSWQKMPSLVGFDFYSLFKYYLCNKSVPLI